MTEPVEVMVDLETLSTNSNAKIIQIGATKFTRTGGSTKRVGVKDVFKKNVVCPTGHVSVKTEEWWEQQVKKAPALADSLNDPEPIDIIQALSEYRKFCHGAVSQWSNGSSFDCVILEWHFAEHQMRNPFQFWKYRDTRTVYDMLDPNDVFKERSKSVVRGDAHDAVVDCMRQVYRLQCCFREFERRNLLALKASF